RRRKQGLILRCQGVVRKIGPQARQSFELAQDATFVPDHAAPINANLHPPFARKCQLYSAAAQARSVAMADLLRITGNLPVHLCMPPMFGCTSAEISNRVSDSCLR